MSNDFLGRVGIKVSEGGCGRVKRREWESEGERAFSSCPPHPLSQLDEIFSKKIVSGWMELLDPDAGKNTYVLVEPDVSDKSGVFKAMYDYEPRESMCLCV